MKMLQLKITFDCKMCWITYYCPLQFPNPNFLKFDNVSRHLKVINVCDLLMFIPLHKYNCMTVHALLESQHDHKNLLVLG